MEMDKLKACLQGEEKQVIEWRRWFHQHPEISLKEEQTSDYILNIIQELGLSYEMVGEYGILARLEGGRPGKTVLVRADMDALPVQEKAENLKGAKTCISKTAGVSHACGHDAHMAMTLGSMKILSGMKDELSGSVLFAFEQAEETGGGILAMMEALDKYEIDTCYGTHVYAGLSSGKISVQPGERMAALTAFTIKVKGKGGHASRPDLTVNPLMCTANILVNLNNIWTGEVDPTKTVTLGIGFMQCGEKGNVIADEARFSGSMRYYDVEEGKKAFEAVKRTCEHVAAAHRCQIEYERILQSDYAVVNDIHCSKRAEQGIRELLGEAALGECEPWFATESMAVYLAKYPGVFAFLGIQDEEKGFGSGHHTGEFDLDEQILIKGTAAGVMYVLEWLKA